MQQAKARMRSKLLESAARDSEDTLEEPDAPIPLYTPTGAEDDASAPTTSRDLVTPRGKS